MKGRKFKGTVDDTIFTVVEEVTQTLGIESGKTYNKNYLLIEYEKGEKKGTLKSTKDDLERLVKTGGLIEL